MSDLYQLITDVVAKHDCYDYGGGLECRCGESFTSDDENTERIWARHVGRLVGDLLIDLAGTGQLLASIDQIARAPQPATAASAQMRSTTVNRGRMRGIGMDSWRRMIEAKLKAYPGETIIAVAPNDSVLDIEFDGGFGVPYGVPFTVWTQARVLFPVCHGGAESVASVPRNPSAEETPHVGGY